MLGTLVHAQDVMPGRVILKVKPEYTSYVDGDQLNINRLKPVLEGVGTYRTKQLFPNSDKPATRNLAPDQVDKQVDITTVYEVFFDQKIDPLKVAQAIKNTQTVVYSEPRFTAKPLNTPSDELLDSLWHLPIIKAFEAWAIDTGGSDITIAIVDTGVDWDHPDLEGALQENADEIPDNGVDDDENGYIDDVIGWNFFDDNNDPDETGFSHGTHVAGLSGAVVDNALGVAGTGWSCKIMAVKAGDKLNLPFGYDGIVYAADNGADVINCSWGNFVISSVAQDIVQYATYNKQAVLVGGAGNDNRETLFYPASFPEVISVGATDSLDRKADFSNYNYLIDVLAPGARIFSLKNDGYGYDSGTSMSAPIVAGLAGLIKHRYPQLGPLQIQEQIRVSADASIYDLDSNEQFTGKLGTGRIDMKQALLTISSPAFRIAYQEVTDNNDLIFKPGEDIEVGVELANYLLGAGDVQVTLHTDNPFVQILGGEWSIANLPENGRANNLNAPFIIQLLPGIALNEELVLRIEAQDGGSNYKMTDYIVVKVNQDYVNVNVNAIQTSVSNNGLIGYTDFLRTDGLGFQYEVEEALLYEAGLMIGVQEVGETRVVDRIRNGSFNDQDFWYDQIIESMEPDGDRAYYAFGSFTDSSAIRDEIGLHIEQEVYAYDDEAHENYVIIAYTIENRSDEVLENLCAGLFADWDVINAFENQAKTAYGKRLGYVYYTGDDQLTAGIQSLTLLPFNAYMIDNIQGGAGGVDLYDSTGFNSPDKYLTLSSERLEAGMGDREGNDVIQVMANKGIQLMPGEKQTLAFALHAGRSIEQVLSSADAAYERYHGIPPGADVAGIADIGVLWPNPTRDNLTLELSLRDRNLFKIEVYNTLGLQVVITSSPTLYAGYNQLKIDLPELETGIYFLRLSTEGFVETLPFQYTSD